MQIDTLPTVSSLSPRRSPGLLQRLSDRRRVLALIGLAAAAVLGARAARRKAEVRMPNQPPPRPPEPPKPEPTATPVDAPASEAEAVADAAGPAAGQPDEPMPLQHGSVSEAEAVSDAAGPAADQPDEPELSPAEPDAPAEPNTEELAAAELAVLAILSQEGRLEADRTALAVATTLERESVEVAALLRKLKEQGHVAGAEYTATGERIWNVTEAGTGRLD